MQRREVAPDGDVTGSKHMVLAKLRLQHMFFERIEKGARFVVRHTLDLDGSHPFTSRRPDGAVQ